MIKKKIKSIGIIRPIGLVEIVRDTKIDSNKIFFKFFLIKKDIKKKNNIQKKTKKKKKKDK